MLRTAGTLTQAAVLAFFLASMLESATAVEATNAVVPVKGEMDVPKKFAELSAKVNDQPEIRKLKADLEAAQKSYQTAFEAAMKQAAEAPAVKDARQKRNAAKSEDERKVAETEYKTELRKAMLEIDPKLGDMLDKLEGKEKPPVDANKH